MDRWAVSLSGPETAVTAVNSPSQPFQALHACMGGGDVHRLRVGLHAREAATCMHASEASEAC